MAIGLLSMANDPLSTAIGLLSVDGSLLAADTSPLPSDVRPGSRARPATCLFLTRWSTPMQRIGRSPAGDTTAASTWFL